MNPIIQHFQMLLSLHEQMRGGPVQDPYSWLLENGEAFDGPRVFDNWPKGTAKECYRNTFTQIEDVDTFGDDIWAYTEGYAMKESLPIPLGHAWMSNELGEVIETTWETEPDERVWYFGVPFKTEFVREQLLKTQYWGVLFPDEMFNPDLLEASPEEFRAWLPDQTIEKEAERRES